MRLVHYVSGSRADFGMFKKVLLALDDEPTIELGVLALGQHLIEKYGYTVSEIEQTGVTIPLKVQTTLDGDTGAEMSRNFALQVEALTNFWSKNKPDLIVLLGDRGEMLAAALVAMHLGIHVFHVHGGERSGTIDESIRHAISKLSHFHLVSSTDAEQRLLKMGEASSQIFVVGAPGLADINANRTKVRDYLQTKFGIERNNFNVVCAFHPVVQERMDLGKQIAEVFKLLKRKKCSGVILTPNSDAGGEIIHDQIEKTLATPYFKKYFRAVDHMKRADYLDALSNIDLLIGNSSSGIIESASLNVPFLNLGSRQNHRLRNSNVFDCKNFITVALDTTFDQAVSYTGEYENKYFKENTVNAILQLILRTELKPDLLSKLNTY